MFTDQQREEIMKSRYWEKLWHDIIHDIKLGPLPDELKWRFVQLIILAGMNGDDGRLPDLSDMAWELRLSEEKLRSDLPTLARRELVELDADGRWLVTNYAKRQAAMDANERQRRHRGNNTRSASTSASAKAITTFLQEEDKEAEVEEEIVTHNVTNRDTHVTLSLLQEAGIAINQRTRPLLNLDYDYIKAHIDNRGNIPTGLLITKMLAGDPPPRPKNGIPEDLQDIIRR
jgi:phage terminase Nu1 subunit (DNA packaging protein)